MSRSGGVASALNNRGGPRWRPQNSAGLLVTSILAPSIQGAHDAKLTSMRPSNNWRCLAAISAQPLQECCLFAYLVSSAPFDYRGAGTYDVRRHAPAVEASVGACGALLTGHTSHGSGGRPMDKTGGNHLNRRDFLVK